MFTWAVILRLFPISITLVWRLVFEPVVFPTEDEKRIIAPARERLFADTSATLSQRAAEFGIATGVLITSRTAGHYQLKPEYVDALTSAVQGDFAPMEFEAMKFANEMVVLAMDIQTSATLAIDDLKQGQERASDRIREAWDRARRRFD